MAPSIVGKSTLVRFALLAFVAAGHRHGYAIKRASDDRFGPVLGDINTGQIYSTLQRLERDGLVCSEEADEAGRTRRLYRLTDAGRDELRAWTRDVGVGPRLRDDFFLKLVLGPLSGTATAGELIERQRVAYYESLRDIETELAATERGSVPELLLEGAALHIQADLKWLDRWDEWLEANA